MRRKNFFELNPFRNKTENRKNENRPNRGETGLNPIFLNPTRNNKKGKIREKMNGKVLVGGLESQCPLRALLSGFESLTLRKSYDPRLQKEKGWRFFNKKKSPPFLFVTQGMFDARDTQS